MTDKKNPSETTTTYPKTIFGFLYWMWKQIILKKKWWLLPIWALLLTIGMILFLSGHGSVLPAIYIAF